MKLGTFSLLVTRCSWLAVVFLLAPFACHLPPAFALTQFSPSNLLKDGEGSVGVQGGMLSERLSMTGSFGTGAARSRYPLEAVLIGGSGGYGFTESLDAYLSIGGLFSPSLRDTNSEPRTTGFALEAALRYALVSGRSAELGAFAAFDFLSGVSNDATLTIGNVKVAGQIEMRNMAGLTMGIGPQWWWKIGQQKYIFPSVYAFLSPRFVGSGFFTQAASGGTTPEAQELEDVDATARQLIGFGAGLGLDLRTIILRGGVKWFGSLGIGGGLEVPF